MFWLESCARSIEMADSSSCILWSFIGVATGAVVKTTGAASGGRTPVTDFTIGEAAGDGLRGETCVVVLAGKVKN